MRKATHNNMKHFQRKQDDISTSQRMKTTQKSPTDPHRKTHTCRDSHCGLHQ